MFLRRAPAPDQRHEALPLRGYVHVLQHGQAREDAGELESAGNPALEDLIRPVVGDRSTVEQHLA